MQQSCQTYNNSWYIDAEAFSHVALTSHRPAARGPRRPARRARPRADPPRHVLRHVQKNPQNRLTTRGTREANPARAGPRFRTAPPGGRARGSRHRPRRRPSASKTPAAGGTSRRAERKLRFAHRQAVVVYPRRRARWRPIGDRGLKTKRFVSSRPHETKR